ncbi:hypothetical protein PRZ48_000621 [Zasmidium cellare]|uniref:Uncharacterized protein n=1 Tax=Zasmidium cellare TaxID=395010 RepID=A0ABR0F1C2_ZASCE|nr:hypothetical protein PRZ48_000621 [Zasmidium cellare]
MPSPQSMKEDGEQERQDSPLRGSIKFDPENKSYQDIDYSMTSPLDPDGSNFPCKGYQNDRPIRTTVTYAAGSTYNMTLAGTATHQGGSCQISLSYDNGATFRVIKSMIGGCPLVSTYDFTIPSYVPSGTALLGWTWQNEVGNREFYMNCAEVSIISGVSRRRRRDTYNSFESLPYIWKANLEGVNDCTTSEGEDPVYPNPGPDVVYGNGRSSSDSPTSGSCDSPTPYGQTYKDLGDSSSSPNPNGNGTATPASSAVHGNGSGGGNNPNRPPYATGDLTRYLPCVPGSFICTSQTTWKTCNYNDGSVSSSQTWVYVSERQVAAGMECLPFLSPYNSQTEQYAQQENVAGGSYRDDRIVRARPDGDCDTDGALQCTDGGQQFMVCDHGGWVRMGSVAAGTTCSNGKIVAA